MKEFYLTLNFKEKKTVDEIISFVEQNTYLVHEKRFNYIKFSHDEDVPSVFYLNRNSYQEIIIKFREKVEGLSSFPGEKIPITQDLTQVFQYIREAYGYTTEAQRYIQKTTEVNLPPTSQAPIPQPLPPISHIDYNIVASLEDTIKFLLDLFEGMFSKTENNEIFLIHKEDNKKLIRIVRYDEALPPYYQIECLDPYLIQSKKMVFEIDTKTNKEKILEFLMGYLDSSIQAFVSPNNSTPSTSPVTDGLLAALNGITKTDGKIKTNLVHYRFIYLSNKFKKSMERELPKEQQKIYDILEEIEKAPKDKGFTPYLRKFNVNKIGEFFKLRVDDVKRIVFLYDHENGHSVVKMVDFIFDHKFEYLSEIRLESLIYTLWTSKSPAVSNKIPLLNSQQKAIVKNAGTPSIIFGAAGSGKTSISLEKYLSIYMDLLYLNIPIEKEAVLYLTFNSKMAEDIAAQIRLFYPHAFSYTIDEFFADLLGLPDKRVQRFEDFEAWFNRTFFHAFDAKNRKIAQVIDENNPASVAYTYYRGVFKGSLGENFERANEQKYLTKKQLFNYLESEGFFNETMEALWQVFVQYEAYVEDQGLIHDNDLAFLLLKHLEPHRGKFQHIIVDETQDLTQIQLYVLFQLSKQFKIYFFGDTNQTINPTLFSLGMLNSTFYRLTRGQLGSITPQILTKTYRSSKGLIEYTNLLVDLRRKWIASQGEEHDYYHEVADLDVDTRWAARIHQPLMIEKLIEKTLDNPNAIVLVPHHKIKQELLDKFNITDATQNRIYTIFEAKGLEWETVLLYRFIGSELPKFKDMVEGKASRSTIHRMVFNKYYVACTRARKTSLILDDFDYLPLKETLFQSIHEIQEEGLLVGYLNNDITPEAWLKEAKTLFEQYEYRKAHISFERAKSVDEVLMNEWIDLCGHLEKTKNDVQHSLPSEIVMLLKKKKYFNHLSYYYASRNQRVYGKLIMLYQGETFAQEELKSLFYEIDLDEIDLELLKNSSFIKQLDEEEEKSMKKIKEVLKS